jgi:hypothetical protein
MKAPCRSSKTRYKPFLTARRARRESRPPAQKRKPPTVIEGRNELTLLRDSSTDRGNTLQTSTHGSC